MELDISGNMPITIIVYYKCMYLESFLNILFRGVQKNPKFSEKILISFNKAESYTEQ